MILRSIVSLALAAALLALLLAWGDVPPRDLIDAVAALPPAAYAAGLGIHATIYLVRAARFSVLLPADRRPPFLGVLAASAAHNLAAYVLPAKTGEATLVVYLRGHSGVAASAGLASLLVSRLLDLATLLAIVGGVSLSARGAFVDEAAAVAPGLGSALLGASAVLALVCTRPDLPSRAIELLGRRAGLARTRIGRRGLELAGRVGDALRRAASPAALARAALASVAIWGLVFLFYAVLGRAAGLPAELGAGRSVFGASLAVLFNLLPINGFAGFGTQEAGWRIGYELVGIDGALALATGFAVHLVQLANVVLFGVLGHLALPLIGKAAWRGAE
jgi:hypothetical protein